MFLEQASNRKTPEWNWGETDCNQNKFFLCEYPTDNLTSIGSAWSNNEVICPWNLTVSRSAEVTLSAQIPEISPSKESFPLASLIAGLVAGVVLLVCICLVAVVCSRRRKFFGKKTTELLKSSDGYQSTVRKDAKKINKNGKSMRRHKGMNTEQGRVIMTSFEDGESGDFYLSGSNDAVQNTQRDYVTLQAKMDVKDDLELSSTMSGISGKPEVALVTDDIDMSFTVNHAVHHSVSRTGSERSRSSVERVMEEIEFPVQTEYITYFQDYSL